MASSVLDIYNGALSAIRAKGRLSSLSENSREREECDIWYALVRDTVQEASYWPACRATARLALQAERNFSLDWVSTDPAPQWKYRYALPSDYLRAWFLSDYSSFTLEASPTGGMALHTNKEDAVLIYAKRQTAVQYWTPGQRMATVLGLAAHISDPITGKNVLTQRLFKQANEFIREAQSHAANAEEFDQQAYSPILSARGYTEGSPHTRYYYPFGQLFSGAVTDA